MVAHTCNPSTWQAEEGAAQVPGQPGLCSETLSQETNKRGWQSGNPVANPSTIKNKTKQGNNNNKKGTFLLLVIGFQKSC
jgi:hypothetical protein